MAENTTTKSSKGHKAKLKEVELRKAQVELERAEADLEFDKIRLSQQQAARQYTDAADKNHGVFNLDRGVGPTTVELASEIRQWARANPGKPITLNIFSPGGSIFHGFVLYDTLRSLSKKGRLVTTYAHGYAASMGSILFMAGDVRIIGSESHLMLHSLSTFTGGSLHDLIDEVEFCKKLNKRLLEIFVSRSKISMKELSDKTRKTDWWVGASEAKKYGFATEID